jgi:hypothetical protein
LLKTACILIAEVQVHILFLKMGRYYTEPEHKEEKAEVFSISADTIRQVQKQNSFKKHRVQALKYAKKGTAGDGQHWREMKMKKKKSRKEEEDPFPGRKPVDPAKLEENSRGEKVDVKKVKTKFKQKGWLVAKD